MTGFPTRKDNARPMSQPPTDPDAPEPGPSGLPAPRLHKLRRRLAGGFYDRAVVRREIAERIVRDLTEPGPDPDSGTPA
ncbi:MAG: hypothetical protein AB7I33_11775 [Gemmatimonadales bacterium]